MADEEHLLHRQVNPNWIQSGQFSSQTFRPTSKDAGKLSVYDGKQISAGESFAHWTSELNLKSDGVVSVSTGEVEALALAWAIDGTPFPAHGYIDFTGLTKGQVERSATLLKARALARGWSHQP